MSDKSIKPDAIWPHDITSKNKFSSIYISRQQYSIDEASFIPIDVYDTKDYFIIEAEIPGININDVKVSLVEDKVVIEGTKQEKIESEGKVNFLCMERSFGPFRRVVSVEHAVDKTNLKATYSDGVLFIKLPRKEERRERVRVISIKKEDT